MKRSPPHVHRGVSVFFLAVGCVVVSASLTVKQPVHPTTSLVVLAFAFACRVLGSDKREGERRMREADYGDERRSDHTAYDCMLPTNGPVRWVDSRLGIHLKLFGCGCLNQGVSARTCQTENPVRFAQIEWIENYDDRVSFSTIAKHDGSAHRQSK